MSRNSAIEEAILITRVKYLMAQSVLGLVLSPLGSLAVSCALVDEVSMTRLAIWNVGVVLFALIRFFVLIASPRQEEEPKDPRRWELLIGGSMVMVAAWWGLGALIVLPDAPEGNVLVFSAILAMSGGAISMYSAHPRVTGLVVVLMLAPVSIYFIFQDGALYRSLGLVGLLYLVGTSRGIRLLNYFLVRSHELTHELEENVGLLERSEEMRKDLTLMLIHDLRTPLTTLVGRAHIAREYSEEENRDECNQQLDTVVELTDSIVDMVNSLLDINKLESGQLPITKDRFSAREFLETIVDNRNTESGGVRIDCHPEVTLEGDLELLKRVLQNLLDNARRYQPQDTEILLQVNEIDDGLEVRVIDHGPGIAGEYQAKIFDKYSRAARSTYGGNGLGLTFCKLVVERHGGTIGVDSELGKGAQFWFRLPQHS